MAQRADLRAAYLFGSHVNGAPNEFSDIDIAAFIGNAEELGLRGRIALGVEVRERIGDDIEVHFFLAEQLKNASPASFAAYILEHGVRIELEES